jgi:hypothetical protein
MRVNPNLSRNSFLFENSKLQGCYTMSAGKQLLKFQRSIVPPSSGSSTPTRLLDREGGGSMLLHNVGIYQSTWCNISET